MYQCKCPFLYISEKKGEMNFSTGLNFGDSGAESGQGFSGRPEIKRIEFIGTNYYNA